MNAIIRFFSYLWASVLKITGNKLSTTAVTMTTNTANGDELRSRVLAQIETMTSQPPPSDDTESEPESKPQVYQFRKPQLTIVLPEELEVVKLNRRGTPKLIRRGSGYSNPVIHAVIGVKQGALILRQHGHPRASKFVFELAA